MYCQYTYNMVGVIKVKTEVLRMLKETDDYLSGQEICERLNVSRTAVWKVIKQLETEGYEIEAVRNRGYRLRFLGDVLSQAELESSIDSEWAGKNILYFDETDSTNTEIKKVRSGCVEPAGKKKEKREYRVCPGYASYRSGYIDRDICGSCVSEPG